MQSSNVVFTGRNEVKVLLEPLPDLQDGQVLVRSRKTLISTGTECICLSRNFAPGTHWDKWVKYPFYAGYSNAGEVVAVASDVKTLRPGDRVASQAAHRQFYLIDAAHTLKIPDAVSDESATWFSLAVTVQNGVRRAKHNMGDDVVIVGAGLLGQLAVQYASLSGARSVISIDMAPRRLEFARAHGATHTLEMGVEEARDAVFEITEGRGADVVYDITGHPKVLSGALPLLRKFGKLMIVGDAGSPSEQRLTPDVINRGLQIIGAHAANPPQVASDENSWTRFNMGHLFFHYIEQNQMRVDNLITHHFSPADAADAYHLLLTDRSAAMGVIFDWDLLH
jgi:2-desacetyl-2-hydroxyethyl bacteriochlorophyllide A dehydrogenase